MGRLLDWAVQSGRRIFRPAGTPGDADVHAGKVGVSRKFGLYQYGFSRPIGAESSQEAGEIHKKVGALTGR